MYYIILNTENNKKQGYQYGYTTEKPADSLDFRTLMEVNGTEYDTRTPQAVVDILEKYRQDKIRLELDYGDTETGKSWGEVNNTTGYIGRSTGSHKIPLLIHNSRCIGGAAILDHCILRIRETSGKRIIYQHPNYKAA